VRDTLPMRARRRVNADVCPFIHHAACTLRENTSQLSALNACVLAVNVWTLLLTITSEVFIYRRERFLNLRLKVDDQEPPNNLARPMAQPDGSYKTLLELHPAICAGLRASNRAVSQLAKFTSTTICVNVTFSSAFVLVRHSAGYTSVLSLITSTMLIGTRFLTAAFVCSEGLALPGHESVSLYTFMRAVFNRLDTAEEWTPVTDTSRSGRLQLADRQLEERVADHLENVLQMKALPRTKSAIGRAQLRIVDVFAACTGGGGVRQSEETAAEVDMRDAGADEEAPPVKPNGTRRGRGRMQRQ